MRELTWEQKRDWLRLIRSENVGSATFRSLINKYGSSKDALYALPELAAKGGLRRKIKIYSQENAEKDLIIAEKIGAKFSAWGEKDYPNLLHHIDNSPPIITPILDKNISYGVPKSDNF